MCRPIDEAALAVLRETVAGEMSPYRFAHTKGVEETVALLADLYLPEKAGELRAAALLHDLTKEWPTAHALSFLEAHGVFLRDDERESPKILHGITAPLVIKEAYADFATSAVLSAVRWHTTGRFGMTLFELLLYLADYIEPGRRFPDCVALRRFFFDARPEAMSPAARLCHLWQTALRSFDMTLAVLAAEGAPTCADTLAARAYAAQIILKGTQHE